MIFRTFHVVSLTLPPYIFKSYDYFVVPDRKPIYILKVDKLRYLKVFFSSPNMEILII